MKKTILLLFLLITRLALFAQIVTEKTRDEAYLAPNTKITAITWYDENGNSLKFYPNGTFSMESITPLGDDMCEMKFTMKGRWTRTNKLYFDYTLDPSSTTIQLKNKGLSERKFEEKKEAIKPILSETRKKRVVTSKTKIGRLDDSYFVLIETDESHQRELRTGVYKSKAQLQKEKAEEKIRTKEDDKLKAEILSEIGNVPREVESIDDDQIFREVEVKPEFPGGKFALMQFLSENIKYPAISHENGIQGRVVVQFVVNKDGSIVDPVIMRSVDPYLDKEAIRVVSLMPKWKPAKHNGKAVRCFVSCPVAFRLQ